MRGKEPQETLNQSLKGVQPLGSGTNATDRNQSADHGNKNIPRIDLSKKIPKISRWSETSPAVRRMQSSGHGNGKKGNEQSKPLSQSGFNPSNPLDKNPYGDNKFDNYSQGQAKFQEIKPVESSPSPEDPKYKVHRASLNL